MSGPRLLSEALPGIAGKIFERKYIMLGRLVTRWPEIVGEDLALKTQPVAFKRYGKGKGKKPETSLEISASTADATVLHYQKGLILERINQIFGEQFVSAIRFVPVTSVKQPKARNKKTRPLSPRQKRTLAESLEDIQDPEIREQLLSLGEAIMDKS